MLNPMPTIADVERICEIENPVIRNLQITQCYHELSLVMADRSGFSANWCTFATWASKQAGQTIRKEDLAHLLENRLSHSTAALQASQQAAFALQGHGASLIGGQQRVMLKGSNFNSAIERASGAVGRGNKKVFEEIGFEFARFFQTCLRDQPIDPQKVAHFCDGLREGNPPEGQGYLRRAFRHYAQSFDEADSKRRAELMLLANIEIGFHEQTRLQPEIAESLDAGLLSFLDFVRPLFRSLFPLNGWLHLAHLYLRRWLGRPTALDLAIQALLKEAGALLRQAITDVMMTICFPAGVVVRLGKDLEAGFPETLQVITFEELADFLGAFDETPDSLSGSGARDWANLPERLHFIIDFFRCYQEREILFEPPFTSEQVEAMRAGRLPLGRL